jgi:hypothetical protein
MARRSVVCQKPLAPPPKEEDAKVFNGKDEQLAEAVQELSELLQRVLGTSSTASKPFIGKSGQLVRWVDATELSKILGKTPKTLFYWVKCGVIPGSKLPTKKTSWLFDLFEVDRALRSYIAS